MDCGFLIMDYGFSIIDCGFFIIDYGFVEWISDSIIDLGLLPKTYSRY